MDGQISITDYMNTLGNNESKNSVFLDIKATAEKLSVSTATIRNWVKLGRLSAADVPGRKLLFNKMDVESLVADIVSGKSDKLTKRRNKKAVKGIDLYTDYIRDESGENIVIGAYLAKKEPSTYTESNIRVLLAHFALELYLQSANRPLQSINSYLAEHDDGFSILLQELLGTSIINEEDLLNLPVPQFVQFQDFLGFIYISVNKIADRKITGSYFTPIDVVDHLMNNLSGYLHSDKCLIDPCCGTGNFLLAALKRGVPIENIFGNDIDEISVLITKLNFFINGIHDLDLLNSHFKNVDSLKNEGDNKYDIVVGNPPWGYAFSKEEIKELMKRFTTASKHGTESYDLFIEQSLNKLAPNGILAYVLPEAVLNVKSHIQARSIIAREASLKFISYIGNAFPGVVCPCILLGVEKDGQGKTSGCLVENNNEKFTISTERNLQDEYWNFNLSDQDAECLKKIANTPKSFCLKGQADFALGIVTGANKEYISNEKNDGNEMVLKGSHIHKYSFEKSSSYIRFEPENFQQVALTEMYRAPEKLVYRFICATPVFAYDDHQTLSLNSANILIPHVDGISMKYIFAILNSRTVSFWCRKKYNSVKLLRSHIEGIPIPTPTDHQQEEIVNLTNSLIDTSFENSEERFRLYSSIEDAVMSLYRLNEAERKIINDDSVQYDTFL
ncbi:MAG: TaqI-like C-terminal specificity domain-containing protein [Oribacterium sp.]